VQSAFRVTLQEGHTTLASHESTLKVLKTTSTTTTEDIYALTLTSIRLSHSRGFILNEGLIQASSERRHQPTFSFSVNKVQEDLVVATKDTSSFLSQQQDQHHLNFQWVSIPFQ